MIEKVIHYSIHNKLVTVVFVLCLIGFGTYSISHLPLDAVPDITTNQVQVITQSPTLATQEVEQYITAPVELALANLPDIVELRSTSRFGLSVVTVVFKDDMDIYLARQLISEQLKGAEKEIPEAFGSPELGPITTGLGEIYQYILHVAEGYENKYTDTDLRTFNDWIVKRQLAGSPGVIEVSSWGGHLKQYEVSVDPRDLKSVDVTLAELYNAVVNNNENTGGSYIEKRFNAYFIRGQGMVENFSDIEQIIVKHTNGNPIRVKDVAEVRIGSAPRFGAITWNGKGEVVGGQVMMLKGENSYAVVNEVKKRIETIRTSLPEGVILEPFNERSGLIKRAINTVKTNLIEGGLIVVFILVILLGNWRGGLIVASVIPLSMLFAVGMMRVFGVSANLMSLGAIDFGLIVDGSVIVVESIVHRLNSHFGGQSLSRAKMDVEVERAAGRIRKSAAFGEIIILMVYLPILALTGIEGKMFGPMAKTVSFAIIGALILSMTYVPMMSAAFLKRRVSVKRTLSDRIMSRFQAVYHPVLKVVLNFRITSVLLALLMFGGSVVMYNRLGGEFLPTLEEGDFALHQILPPGSSLEQSVEISGKLQKILLAKFPEVAMVVTKIGTSEIPTDPMPFEVGDIMVKMKPRKEWVTATNREDMFKAMEKELSVVPGVGFEFTQPIQMRFNELIAGVREDIAIKIFGEDQSALYEQGLQVASLIRGVKGVRDIRVEQVEGLPQIVIDYDRNQIAKYNLTIKDINLAVRMAFSGEKAGVVFEKERRFDLVVRLSDKNRTSIDDIRSLFIPLPNGEQVSLDQVADIRYEDGPAQISRENGQRRIVIGVNGEGGDMEGIVEDIQEILNRELQLPAGYFIRYGGQFENLVKARSRLSIAVPAALLLILVLLYFTFGSVKQTIMIFTAIPLSAIGGIYSLWIRDMPFSISAGVGFIALFGVAVLNGIVLISSFNHLKEDGVTNIRQRILDGTSLRLRPVIMTASVAALGFLPMALSSSAGAEVQRPLATVVIGGLVSATILTLFILPALYSLVEGLSIKKSKNESDK